MDRGFINRSIKAAVIVTLIFSPFVLLYFGRSAFLGFFAGAVWNILNVFLLSKILSIVLLQSRKEKIGGIIAAIIKFPVLYGGGFLILNLIDLSIYGILAGFSIILIVFVLKTLGIYMKNSLWKNERAEHYGRSS